MQETNLEKKRGILSSLALFAQSGYSAILGFASFFLLSIKSSVAVLGIYNTVLASLSFFNYITNLGLGAALVQKKEITDKHLSSALIFQTFLSLILALIGFFYTDFFLQGYKNLPYEAKFIFWALLFSLVLVSLRTPPSVLLEREVKIYKVVIVQSLENTIFYLSVIIFAFLEKPLQGIILGIVLRSLIGLLVIYIFRPWRPRLAFSFAKLKDLLSYGLLFQGNSFLALLKDDLLTIYLSKTIGFQNLGFITFAKKYAEIPLRIITDNLNRVFFPLFARAQQKKEKLAYLIDKLLKYNSLIVLPILVGSLFVFKPFLQLIPGYFEKWQETIFMFYLFIISSIFVAFMTPFINLFNAIGRVSISLKFMMLWTALMWILTPLFIHFLGYQFVPLAFVLTNATFVVVIKTAKKYVDFSIIKSVKNVFLALQTMILFLLGLNFSKNFVQLPPINYLLIAIPGSAFVYFLTLLYFEGKSIFTNVIKILKG